MKNYDGNERLRNEIATLCNSMNDVLEALTQLEKACPPAEDCLVVRMAGQSLRRINALYLDAYREMLALDICFED